MGAVFYNLANRVKNSKGVEYLKCVQLMDFEGNGKITMISLYWLDGFEQILTSRSLRAAKIRAKKHLKLNEKLKWIKC